MGERNLWELEAAARARGYRSICGCDEAGAGPLAGPVYAAAVILPEGLVLPGLDDSKKVAPKRREALFDAICDQAVAWSVASVPPEEIDELDILNARIRAMQEAIDGLDPRRTTPSSTATGTTGAAPPSSPPTRPPSRGIPGAPASPQPPFWQRSAGTGICWPLRRSIPSTILNSTRATAPPSTARCWTPAAPVRPTAGAS